MIRRHRAVIDNTPAQRGAACVGLDRVAADGAITRRHRAVTEDTSAPSDVARADGDRVAADDTVAHCHRASLVGDPAAHLSREVTGDHAVIKRQAALIMYATAQVRAAIAH